MLDSLIGRAKRNNWGQKFVVILMVLMMVLTGMAFLIPQIF